MKHIMQIDPKKRYNVPDIKKHPWYSKLQQAQLDGIIIGKDEIPILEQIKLEIETSSQLQFLDGLDKLE